MYVPPLEASPFVHQSPFPSAPAISPASLIPHCPGDSSERWLEHPARVGFETHCELRGRMYSGGLMGEAMQVDVSVSKQHWVWPDVRVCANILSSIARNRFCFYLGYSPSPFPTAPACWLVPYVIFPNLPSITSHLACFYQPLYTYFLFLSTP